MKITQTLKIFKHSIYGNSFFFFIVNKFFYLVKTRKDKKLKEIKENIETKWVYLFLITGVYNTVAWLTKKKNS